MLSTAPSPPDAAAAEPSRDGRPIGRQLACVAAFYADGAQAQAVLAGLAALPGLGPAQWTVLAPTDAGSRRFERLSRRWAAPFQANRKSARSPLYRLSGLGLLLAAALVLLWWLQADVFEVDPQAAPWIWLGLLVAVIAGAGVLAWGGGWRRPARPRRFDRQVRRALAAGRWAVVVHGLPWPAQHAAVALLRGGCVGWCAEPAPGARL